MATANVVFRRRRTDAADEFRQEVRRGLWKYTLFEPALAICDRIEKSILQRSKWDCTVNKYVITLGTPTPKDTTLTFEEDQMAKQHRYARFVKRKFSAVNGANLVD